MNPQEKFDASNYYRVYKAVAINGDENDHGHDRWVMDSDSLIWEDDEHLYLTEERDGKLEKVRVDPDTLCQSSPYPDGNNNLIYEGDVVDFFSQHGVGAGVRLRGVVLLGKFEGGVIPVRQSNFGWFVKYQSIDGAKTDEISLRDLCENHKVSVFLTVGGQTPGTTTDISITTNFPYFYVRSNVRCPWVPMPPQAESFDDDRE